MPFGDGTGPNGLGPRTGRGLGYCVGYNSPGFTRGTPRGRAGFGRGFGRGFGWRYRVVPESSQALNPDESPSEKQYLEEELKTLKESIKEIEDRLKKFEKE